MSAATDGFSAMISCFAKGYPDPGGRACEGGSAL
jgi:hypothetical protein